VGLERDAVVLVLEDHHLRGHLRRLVRVGFCLQRLEGDFGLGGTADSIFIGV
jgi:hypothetical protein